MSIAVNSIMQSGLQGYQDASKQMQQVANNMAHGQHKNIDFNRSAVDLQQSTLQAQASAQVIKRADGMIGTIIDIFV